MSLLTVPLPAQTGIGQQTQRLPIPRPSSSAPNRAPGRHTAFREAVGLDNNSGRSGWEPHTLPSALPSSSSDGGVGGSGHFEARRVPREVRDAA